MTGFRNIAIVGPYSSGKTTLLESLLHVTGVTSRRGSIRAANTVGDASAEARARQMSTEVTAASLEDGGLRFNFLDCPGSVELLQESLNALVGVDAAVVVCEADPKKVQTLAPLFHMLDDWQIPHLVFLNKMDRTVTPFQDTLIALKSVSARPLVLQQYPIGQGEDLIGFIDLITEQAYQYHVEAPADPIALPDTLKDQEQQARAEMLETLADFDDHLLEALLEDIQPSEAEVRQDLKLDLGADLIVPVLIGVAEQAFGVRPLLDILAKEAPDAAETLKNRGLQVGTAPIAQVLKTYISAQGKLSLVRIWQGTLTDGMQLSQGRISGIYRLLGQQQESLAEAVAGEIVALGRLETVQTGDGLSTQSDPLDLPRAPVLPAVFAWAVQPQNRKDEVKLTTVLNKLTEEDPSLSWRQETSTHDVLLWGQGDIHLQIAGDRLRNKYSLPVEFHPPHIAYLETIRQSTSSHGRYKHQTGGHGQFGDVHLDIQPQPRGEGVRFTETIVGGAVPKQYIPGVEMGVRESLEQGVYGFPVVDVSVTLTDGSYHSVDSSEQAFKLAARQAMQSGLPHCQPLLLEPIERVTISVPTEFTANILRLITNRRGQILGYDHKPDWTGWDEVSAYLPMAEMHGLITELRSASQGVSFFQWQDDHMAAVPDKIAEQVLAKLETAS